MNASLTALEYFLPETVDSTESLAAEFPEWNVEKIDRMTGIRKRHVASAGDCTSDLAVQAARKLFETTGCDPASIDFVLLCTETPDYLLPPTACLVQDRLGIPTTAGALDFNLGSSGYVYGLGMAQGLIATGQARNILLLTADTYSKLVHRQDRSTRTIFGDAACATWIQAIDSSAPLMGPFIYGSDGRGAQNLIVPAGGMRQPWSDENSVAEVDENGSMRSPRNLYMNGGEIFNFTLAIAPLSVQRMLQASGMDSNEIDLFIFHQANAYILEHLRKKLKIPQEKFFVSLSEVGNTVSCTIPIALKDAMVQGRVKPGFKVMLVGFGVGYSWGATIIRFS